ncbi:MAG: DUF475 domain-containing protein [Candidatus Spechtbacteria bacterium]|nr:DUF475 domain-containing protein [Candidatus Spechtbacteria bacterium]
MFTVILVILGLVVFEVVNSVDNAIVNAHVLKTMSQRARQWFLIWGIFIAVVVVRGLLPLVIVWLTAPGTTLWGALQAMMGSNEAARQAIDASAYILLMGGGMFMLLLYLHWLFLEKKDPYFVPDKLIKPHMGIWFFAFAALLLVGILYMSRENPFAMIAAATGNAVFFILYGFREVAEREEATMEKAGRSDFAKIMFLEVLDASFSIDGVIGAFAFTTNVLFILIGNGIGAFVVRDLTLRGIEKVGRYKWLKNGAMTSIGFLGITMLLRAFGVHIAEWIPTLVTIGVVGIAFWASHRYWKKNGTSATI